VQSLPSVHTLKPMKKNKLYWFLVDFQTEHVLPRWMNRVIWRLRQLLSWGLVSADLRGPEDWGFIIMNEKETLMELMTHHSRIPKEVTSNFRGNRYSCTKILAVSRPISGFWCSREPTLSGVSARDATFRCMYWVFCHLKYDHNSIITTQNPRMVSYDLYSKLCNIQWNDSRWIDW
jgi:hypothetical protein